eukprot:Sdes_comp19485_c0_seq1m10973
MSAKPAPPPKKNKIQVYRALYDYCPQNPDELAFSEGDLLFVEDKSHPDWFRGSCKDKKGLIPANYVESENASQIDNPVHEAAKRGNLPFLEELIQANVSVNGIDKSGSVPLHWAAGGGHVECVDVLLNVPTIQLNVQNKLGDTPLHNAAWKGHAAIVEKLIMKNADTTLKNKEGHTAFQLARNPQVGSLLQNSSTVCQDDYQGQDIDSD